VSQVARRAGEHVVHVEAVHRNMSAVEKEEAQRSGDALAQIQQGTSGAPAQAVAQTRDGMSQQAHGCMQHTAL